MTAASINGYVMSSPIGAPLPRAPDEARSSSHAPSASSTESTSTVEAKRPSSRPGVGGLEALDAGLLRRRERGQRAEEALYVVRLDRQGARCRRRIRRAELHGAHAFQRDDRARQLARLARDDLELARMTVEQRAH